MKVRLPSLNLFYYPDVAVTCDRRDRASDEDFILHPKLIIEVLSDSTESYDRGDKFSNYKIIPELEEYILIHQKQILVERFQRKSDNLWIPQIYHAGDNIELESIGFSCAIASALRKYRSAFLTFSELIECDHLITQIQKISSDNLA